MNKLITALASCVGFMPKVEHASIMAKYKIETDRVIDRLRHDNKLLVGRLSVNAELMNVAAEAIAAMSALVKGQGEDAEPEAPVPRAKLH